MHAGLCRGGPIACLATRGIKMEMKYLNKTMYEELFGGELGVTEETVDAFETDNSQVRRTGTGFTSGTRSSWRS